MKCPTCGGNMMVLPDSYVLTKYDPHKSAQGGTTSYMVVKVHQCACTTIALKIQMTSS